MIRPTFQLQEWITGLLQRHSASLSMTLLYLHVTIMPITSIETQEM